MNLKSRRNVGQSFHKERQRTLTAILPIGSDSECFFGQTPTLVAAMERGQA